MSKLKPTKLLMLACLLLAGYACTTKNEIPQPVVDTARVDALRTQLIALQQQVLGAEQAAANDSLTITQLQAEIARLQADLQKSVSYTVTVNSFLFKPLAGATVKLSQGGKVVSATTASNGSATFSGLYAGIITATVDLNGFARLVFRADIRNDFDGTAVYSTNSLVLMIPLGGTAQADSCMTTQYWKLYANYNMVDDTLGGPVVQGGGYFNSAPASNPLLALPAGPDPNNPNISYTAVTTQPITVSLNQYSFLDGNSNSYVSYAIPIGFTGWDFMSTGQTGNGQVISVTYENTLWTATAVNGVYTVKLPASDISNNNTYLNSANVFGFVIDFGEFTHDFTQYTDGRLPHIINGSSPLTPTYTSTYLYQMSNVGGFRWTSVQSTSLTAAWPFFFYGTLK